MQPIIDNLAIKETFDFLQAHISGLTDSQIQLVNNMKKYFKKHGELSARQMQVLTDIRRFESTPDINNKF